MQPAQLGRPLACTTTKSVSNSGDDYVLRCQGQEWRNLALNIVPKLPTADMRLSSAVKMAQSNAQVDQSDFGVRGVWTGPHASSVIATFGDNSNVSFRSPKARKSSAPAIKACRNMLLLTEAARDRSALIGAKGDRVDGTCEWVKDNKLYIDWEAGRLALLWICGGPGKGKTMLSNM